MATSFFVVKAVDRIILGQSIGKIMIILTLRAVAHLVKIKVLIKKV